MGSKADRAGTYAQRLIENDYVQENLLRAADNLRAAYRRATKRRVEPTRDEKLRRQLRQAALSFREAASALQADRRTPKRRRGATCARGPDRRCGSGGCSDRGQRRASDAPSAKLGTARTKTKNGMRRGS